MFPKGGLRVPTQRADDILPFALFLAVVAVYAAGLPIPVMNVDAAQYAAISAEMYRAGEYLEVKNRGADYLDKPPLLFWLAALSFHFLGVNTVAYKLPALLAVLMGLYATYRLAALFYDKDVARWAALMAASTQAFFLFTNDVRTDALLTGFVMLSIWQLTVYAQTLSNYALAAGCVAVALAMLAKGPIGAVVPAVAVGTHLLLKRRWQVIWRWQTLGGLAGIILILLPMLWGLTAQFGLKGPQFFFWTQSFGRITGENPWRNDAGFFYFWKELLWSFLPFSLLLFAALVFHLGRWIRKKAAADALPEYISLAGFLLPLIMLSFSHYKLPHYIFVLFPLGAISTATFYDQMRRKGRAAYWLIVAIQTVVITIIFYLAYLVHHVYFPITHVGWWMVFAGLVVLTYGLLFKNRVGGWSTMHASVLAMVTANLLLSTHAYPQLLRYQAGIVMAEQMRGMLPGNAQLYWLDFDDYSLEFYLNRSIEKKAYAALLQQLQHGEDLWVIGADSLIMLKKKFNDRVAEEYVFTHFHVTILTKQFLDPATRPDALRAVRLVRFRSPTVIDEGSSAGRSEFPSHIDGHVVGGKIAGRKKNPHGQPMGVGPLGQRI